MSILKYVEGDVTRPEGPGHKVVVHVCNDEGKWGAGVSGAIGTQFPQAAIAYRNKPSYILGEVDFIKVPFGITIANMIAQRGVRKAGVKRAPIRYGALAEAMERVRAFCYADGLPWCSIHAPRFGSGLSGGHWPTIEALILEMWVDADIEVVIYDLEA